jgi:hypothetical protein
MRLLVSAAKRCGSGIDRPAEVKLPEVWILTVAKAKLGSILPLPLIESVEIPSTHDLAITR